MDKTKGMDFDKYAYFKSKAKNYCVIVKERVEEITASGDKRVAKDDEGKQMVGLKIEFKNHQKRLERTKENAGIIKFLEDKCKVEKKGVGKGKRSIEQEFKPVRMIPETEIKGMMSDKDKKIKELEEKLKVKK